MLYGEKDYWEKCYNGRNVTEGEMLQGELLQGELSWGETRVETGLKILGPWVYGPNFKFYTTGRDGTGLIPNFTLRAGTGRA